MAGFRFKQFTIEQENAPFKVGTDSMILGSWITLNGNESVLDIGTGTGILALMVAQKLDNGKVLAAEPNGLAFEIAKANFENAPFADKIIALNEPLQRLEPNAPLDVIISNPPYFSNSTPSATESSAQARHTEGLSFKEICAFADRNLSASGQLAVVLPLNEFNEFKADAGEKGLHSIKECHVRSFENSKVIRVCGEFSKTKSEIEISELAIRNSDDNSYSSGYIELTKDFHVF